MSDYQQAQPGWYPTDDGYQRYWDGQQWTEHRAPLQGAQGAAPQPYQAQPQQPGYAQPGYAQPGGAVDANDNGIAVLGHLGGLLFGFLVPLVIYLIKKDESAYLRHHSAEALNFQITIFIALIVSFILIFVIIGIFLVFAVIIASWVFGIIAAIAANKGEWYRYPMTIRMIN